MVYSEFGMSFFCAIEAELGIWGQNLLELAYRHTSQLELPFLVLFLASNSRTYALSFRSS